MQCYLFGSSYLVGRVWNGMEKGDKLEGEERGDHIKVRREKINLNIEEKKE